MHFKLISIYITHIYTIYNIKYLLIIRFFIGKFLAPPTGGDVHEELWKRCKARLRHDLGEDRFANRSISCFQVSQRLPYANHLSNFDMQVDDRLIGVNEPIVFFLNVFLKQCRSQTQMKVTVSNEQKKNHEEKITRTKLKTRQVKKRWKSTYVINFSREKCVTVMNILKT